MLGKRAPGTTCIGNFLVDLDFKGTEGQAETKREVG